MPSLIPGFEYDIFISYRHKDNKYDGWVSEFVANLRRELEATFKEEVSVYFDENPHDGLLETHNVDNSLEGKLKCLILIPIISQTYCDTKSFAWQQEFCSFNKWTKEDSFGIYPRAAVAVDATGRTLIFAVVDGKQPGFSEGMSLPELAELLRSRGAYHAINLDGGGSVTLVARDKSGKAVALNSPIHTRIPGRQRPVANQFGIRVAGH